MACFVAQPADHREAGEEGGEFGFGTDRGDYCMRVLAVKKRYAWQLIDGTDRQRQQRVQTSTAICQVKVKVRGLWAR